MNIVIGQEAVCPDGLGRVIAYRDEFLHQWVQVQTYVNDRSCKWGPQSVKLIPPPPTVSCGGESPQSRVLRDMVECLEALVGWYDSCQFPSGGTEHIKRASELIRVAKGL